MRNCSPVKLSVWTALFLDSAALAIALPVLPELIEKLAEGSVSRAAAFYGLLLAMSGVLLFFCGPIQASLSDLFGRKKMLIVASLGSAVGFLALACAPNLLCLFAAQAIYAASGATQPVASCLISDLSEPHTRASQFAKLTSIITLGFIVGASAGGFLGQYGLNFAMLTAAATCIAASLMMFFGIEETRVSPDQCAKKFEIRTANPISSIKFLYADKSRAEHVIIMICADFAFQAFLSTWVLFTTIRYHWTIAQAGASMALEGLFAVAVQLIFLRFALPRLGVRNTLIASLLFESLALVLYNCIDGSLIVVAVIAIHCMGAAVRPTCSAALSASVTSEEQAKLQGAIGSQYALSSVLAMLLGTSLFSYFTSSSAPIVFPGVSSLLGILALSIALLTASLPYISAVARSWTAGRLQFAFNRSDSRKSN
jgi:DHA1 family tetracycline resistance protein-like MFS transporter